MKFYNLFRLKNFYQKIVFEYFFEILIGRGDLLEYELQYAISTMIFSGRFVLDKTVAILTSMNSFSLSVSYSFNRALSLSDFDLCPLLSSKIKKAGILFYIAITAFLLIRNIDVGKTYEPHSPTWIFFRNKVQQGWNSLKVRLSIDVCSIVLILILLLIDYGNSLYLQQNQCHL